MKSIFGRNLEFLFPIDRTLSSWLSIFCLCTAAVIGYAFHKLLYGCLIGVILGIGSYFKYLQHKTILFLVNNEIKFIHNDSCISITLDKILRIENNRQNQMEVLEFFFTDTQALSLTSFAITSNFPDFADLKKYIEDSPLSEKLLQDIPFSK